MNPVAPVSMLTGKGSGTAIMVIAALVGLAMFAKQQKQPLKTNN